MSPVTSINLTRFTLIGFVGLYMIGAFLLRSNQFVRNFWGPLGWMLVYAAISVASASYSSLPLLSAGQSLAVVVDVLFFVAVCSFCTPSEVISLWNLFLFFLCLILAAVWVSAIVMPSIGFVRIPGALLPLQLQGAFPSVHPDDLGEISAIVTATAFYRILASRKPFSKNEVVLWVSILVFGLTSLVFAQARTSVVTLGAALIAILFLTRKVGLLSVLAVSGCVFVVGGGGEFLRDYLMRGQSYELFYSMTGRVGIWDAAWIFLKGSPIIGYGFDTAHRFDLMANQGPQFTRVGTVENTFLAVMLDVGIVGLLPILAAMYQLVVWLSQTFRVASLRWRFRKTRCEITAALVIVFIKMLNGPTFEGHSIYLFTLLISMAFIQVLLKQPRASTRSKIGVIQSFGRLVASDRTA